MNQTDETFVGTGSCLCGQVSFESKTVSKSLGACHCHTCTKWSAGPFLTLDCGTDITFKNEEAIQTYNSSEWAERGFCKNCGTTLFYKLKQKQQYILSAHLFDDISSVVFDHQIFVDEKSKHYSFADKTHNMTGAEVFAKYA